MQINWKTPLNFILEIISESHFTAGNKTDTFQLGVCFKMHPCISKPTLLRPTPLTNSLPCINSRLITSLCNILTNHYTEGLIRFVFTSTSLFFINAIVSHTPNRSFRKEFAITEPLNVHQSMQDVVTKHRQRTHGRWVHFRSSLKRTSSCRGSIFRLEFQIINILYEVEC